MRLLLSLLLLLSITSWKEKLDPIAEDMLETTPDKYIKRSYQHLEAIRVSGDYKGQSFRKGELTMISQSDREERVLIDYERSSSEVRFEGIKGLNITGEITIEDQLVLDQGHDVFYLVRGKLWVAGDRCIGNLELSSNEG